MRGQRGAALVVEAMSRPNTGDDSRPSDDADKPQACKIDGRKVTEADLAINKRWSVKMRGLLSL